MNGSEKYISLWTTDKDKYYIGMLDDSFYIMGENNMMLLIEEPDDVYLKIIESMIKNGVKVFIDDFKIGAKTYIPSDEAIKKLKEISKMREKVKVKVKWKKEVPISKQILQLKKISKEIADMQVSQLFKKINMQENEWTFCETTLKEAETMRDMAIDQGIQLEIEKLIN